MAPDVPSLDVSPVDETPADDLGVAVLPEAPAAGPMLVDIPGVDADIAQRLESADIRTVADLAAASVAEVVAATGLPEERVISEDWIGHAQRMMI
jgi:predicted flap endonuclease-1-like 5' DNA nuclease